MSNRFVVKAATPEAFAAAKEFLASIKQEIILENEKRLSLVVNSLPLKMFMVVRQKHGDHALDFCLDTQYQIEIPNAQCTCGSGGHPRSCLKHPGAKAAHIEEIEYWNKIEETWDEIRRADAEGNDT